MNAEVFIWDYPKTKAIDFLCFQNIIMTVDDGEVSLTTTTMSSEEIDPEYADYLRTYCFNISETGAPPKPHTVLWLEGVTLTITGIIGIIGNTITALVLNRISLNNVFNQVRSYTLIKY